MKVLLINGSPHKDGCTFTALSEVSKVLKENDIETEFLQIGIKPISGCLGCGKCSQTGRCILNDMVNEVHDRLEEFDGIVIGSPVYFASPSGQVQCFLDRLFQSAFYDFKGKLGAAVVSCRRGGAASTFDSLNKYFTITNMHVVGSQYWNQVHGFTKEDVRKDEEGLQTMRTLGQNMAWLLKSIKIAGENGLEEPEYEEHLWTHFIR